MSARYSLARDLDELERMVERLDDYLLGDALYLPIGGGLLRGPSRPQMTIGALLLRRRRLTCLRAKLKRADGFRLDAALAQHNELQREWRLHYEKQLSREIQSRLKLMTPFFQECQEDPSNCASAYPVEALRRTIAQEILLALDEFGYATSVAIAAVFPVDQALRRILHAGDFIWAPQLEAVYPKAAFWWLFGEPSR